MKRSGFTLVELIVVITIVAILAITMIGVFNAPAIFNKARDASRKKDIGRIRVAFEEYFNDKGCYPSSTLVADLNNSVNCNKAIFSPWLSNWPCDPSKQPYKIIVEDSRFSKCNKWFKILTNLENKSDANIPVGWKYLSTYTLGGEITAEMVNYGVSSSNINWFDVSINPECAMFGGCYYKPDPVDAPNVCNSAGTGCVGPNCYTGLCKLSCQVACCGRGCR